jgi:branched-subunit amino acid aminotransferase/4-amino-4-deoxychorismate lyase
MDENILRAIDDKLSKVEWHLVRILDAIQDIGFDRETAERLVIQTRDVLIQQIKEQNNDK